MSLFGKIFGNQKEKVVIDLTIPYRTLLAGQTNTIVRGVLLHAIASMEDLQKPISAEHADEINKKLEKQLEAAQRKQATDTPKDTAVGAIVVAVSFIMIKSAGEVLYGKDMVIRGISGADSLKKAAMCYAFGLFIFKALVGAFVQAGVISMEDKQVVAGEWKSILLSSCFPLATLEQKVEILKQGGKMFQGINERSEANVTEFIDTLEKLTLIAAINWESKKVAEQEILGLFKQKADVLLNALT